MKKILALVLTLSLVLCASLFASAAEVPSITASDLVDVEYMTDVAPEFAVVLSDIGEQGWIAEKLPTIHTAADLDPSAVAVAGGNGNWEVSEAFGTTVINADKQKTDLGLKMAFPTVFSGNAGLVFTFEDGSAMGVPAEVNEDGSLNVTLDLDLITRLGGEQALLAVINSPAE